MNKFIALSVASISIMTFATPAAPASIVVGNLNVTVTLTSVCTMSSIGTLAFGTYVAFQSSALSATSTSATLSCTRGLSGVTAAFDTSPGIGATGATAASTATGAGVIAGLEYNITATPGAVVPGNAASATDIGTADSRPYTISGTILADQAGTAASGLQTQARTLTINY